MQRRGGGQTLRNGSMQYRGFLKKWYKITQMVWYKTLWYKITQNISKNIHIQ